jgi:predicted solute-binding protein
MAKQLGIIPRLYAQPLVQGLMGGKSRAGSFAEIIEDTPERISTRLREEELHGALLSPLEYAAHYADLRILPGIGVVSEGESASIELVFKEGLRTFGKIAVDPSHSSEALLARLVLAEKYETTPEVVRRGTSLTASLENADAVLVVDRDMATDDAGGNRIDLIGEWFDITELPYVHLFWALRENAFTASDLSALRDYSLEGTKSFEPYIDQIDYLEQFRYDLDDAAVEGISEFMRMAYYYGMLKDLPDVRFASL